MLASIKAALSGGWVKLGVLIASILSELQRAARDRKVGQDAVNAAKVEQRAKDDKIIADINRDAASKRVRDDLTGRLRD